MMTMLQDKLKPLTTSMKLLGIYHLTFTPKVGSTMMGVKTKPKKKMLGHIFSFRTYSFVVLILVWANFLRYIPGLLPVDPTITFRLILLMWFAMLGFSSTIMFVACEKSSHLQSFYKHWNDMYEGAKSLIVDTKDKRFSRSAITATIVGWVIVLINVSGNIGLIFWIDMGFTKDILRPFPEYDATKGAACVVVTLGTGINAFSVMFLITTCHIIKTFFYKLSDVLRKQIQDGGEIIPECLREIRLHHVRLCECVSVLDRTFRIFIAMLFATNLPLVCFILYQFVNYQPQLFVVLMYLFWLTSSVFTLSAVTISASLVHEAAHSPLEDIFKIQGKRTSIEETLQVSLFLSQLTGRQVGFTVMGIIVVTKEVLFTIAGLFITYFLLLLQFRIS